jgi:hypothetical protein
MIGSQRFISGFLWSAAFACLCALMLDPGDVNRDALFFSKLEYRPFLEDWKKLGQVSELLQSESGDPHLLWTQSESIGAVIAGRGDPDFWTKDRVQDLAQFILIKSRQYKVAPLLVLSLIEVESNFRPEAVSSRGAVGLMQLMPSTAAAMAVKGEELEWTGVEGLSDPKRNIEYGLRYMRKLQGKFRSQKHVLTAYNIGPAALRRKLKNGEALPLAYYEKVMQIMNSHKRAALTAADNRKGTWL